MRSLLLVGAVGPTIAAIYGAVLSTGIALAQFVKWILARRSRIRIEIDVGKGSPWQAGKFAGQGSIALWIEVINEGERDEQIAWLKIDHLQPRATWLDSGTGGGDVIPPRHRKTYLCAEIPAADEEADMELEALEGPYRVRIVLGTGSEFTSEIQSLPSWRRDMAGLGPMV